MLGAGSVKRQSIQICAEEEDFFQKDGQQTEIRSWRKKKKVGKSREKTEKKKKEKKKKRKNEEREKKENERHF